MISSPSGANVMTANAAIGQPRSQPLNHRTTKSLLIPTFNQVINPVTKKTTIKVITTGPTYLACISIMVSKYHRLIRQPNLRKSAVKYQSTSFRTAIKRLSSMIRRADQYKDGVVILGDEVSDPYRGQGTLLTS